MRHVPTTILSLLALASPLAAATLDVGPGQPYARLEDALAKASAGDIILVYPKPNNAPYEKTALLVKTPRLTIRAAAERNAGTPRESLVKLDGTGFNYSGAGSVPRAIAQFNPGSDGCTLESFDLANARNDSNNGAGVRINQANDITIRRCLIHHNDMGIMSNGQLAQNSAANQLIEGCTIADNGSEKDPGYNHNLYLGGTSATVRACEIARAVTGHNLKSRAHFNWIEYNYIHDSANRELDLVDEKGNTDAPNSHTVLLGNFIIKDPRCPGNKAVIHFGQDGKHDHTGTLFLAFNTIVTPFASPAVDLSAPGATAAFYDNLISDRNGAALEPRASASGTSRNATLISARNGATLDRILAAGNDIAPVFLAKAPALFKPTPPTPAAAVIPFDKLPLPWPAPPSPLIRGPLQEFISVGTLQPRKTAAAGAGPDPPMEQVAPPVFGLSPLALPAPLPTPESYLTIPPIQFVSCPVGLSKRNNP